MVKMLLNPVCSAVPERRDFDTSLVSRLSGLAAVLFGLVLTSTPVAGQAVVATIPVGSQPSYVAAANGLLYVVN
ncbi:MAG: hypothetical protein AB1543_07555, partial [Candidatus Bipolaricaulota bacterium]